MAKSIPSISAVILDFDQLVRSNDEKIIDRFRFYSANARKRFFPKAVVFNAYRIERHPERIMIYLLHASNSSEPKTKAICAFIPPPDFSGRMVST